VRVSRLEHHRTGARSFKVLAIAGIGEERQRDGVGALHGRHMGDPGRGIAPEIAAEPNRKFSQADRHASRLSGERQGLEAPGLARACKALSSWAVISSDSLT